MTCEIRSGSIPLVYMCSTVRRSLTGSMCSSRRIKKSEAIWPNGDATFVNENRSLIVVHNCPNSVLYLSNASNLTSNGYLIQDALTVFSEE